MIAVYPGSFDPITNGHVDIIERVSKLADTLIVAILNNPNKNSLFTVEERIKHLEIITKDIINIEVKYFSGLLVDFAKENNAKLIVRGLRTFTDFEYEFQMALANKHLNSDIETFFVPASAETLFVSSSAVKEIAKFKGDFHRVVPEIIIEELKNKFN